MSASKDLETPYLVTGPSSSVSSTRQQHRLKNLLISRVASLFVQEAEDEKRRKAEVERVKREEAERIAREEAELVRQRKEEEERLRSGLTLSEVRYVIKFKSIVQA